MDYVVLKRLTLKSDLGWFRSIYVAHALKGHQKAITLNKKVMNSIWPSLLTRQDAYDAAKLAQKQAKALGSQSKIVIAQEKNKARVVGTLPIPVEIYGPGGKPPINEDRIMILQDKNWRLNGDFILDPTNDPARFYPTMKEGDLALIGFQGVEWPTRAVVVLLSQTIDTALWSDLETQTTKGPNSMVQVDQSALLAVADKHGLPPNHEIRRLSAVGPLPPYPMSPLTTARAVTGTAGKSGISVPLKSKPKQEITPDELAKKLAAGVINGKLGEIMVDKYLAGQVTKNIPVHTWISTKFAEHPYDFELLSDSGSVEAVIDAKATSASWPGVFYMSIAEVHCAATSSVPYHIYRISEVGKSGGRLRVSDDIRSFADATLKALLPHLVSGITVTGIAVKPIDSGIKWSDPIKLPPPPP